MNLSLRKTLIPRRYFTSIEESLKVIQKSDPTPKSTQTQARLVPPVVQSLPKVVLVAFLPLPLPLSKLPLPSPVIANDMRGSAFLHSTL